MAKALQRTLLLSLLSMAILGPSLFVTLADEPNPNARRTEITMGEFYFQVAGAEKNAPITLKAGETVTLDFKNVGVIVHEAMLGRETKMEDGRLHGYKENLLEGVKVMLEHKMRVGNMERKFGIEAESLEELQVEPGMEVELQFTVPNRVGEWELGCFVSGHYQAGQRTTIIIELPDGPKPTSDE